MKEIAEGDVVRVRGEGSQLFVVRGRSVSSAGAVSVKVMGVGAGSERGRFRAFRPDRIRRTREKLVERGAEE